MPGVDAVGAAAWDACAGGTNPFVGHAFLHALEVSGSTGQRTGWLPAHVAVQDDDALAAVAPAYVKSHSYGEYVFDHGWARAFEQAGGRYYPKLQVSVPFTPVPGPRLLVGDGPEADARRDLLVAGLAAAAEQVKVSSVHATFLEAPDVAAFERADWLVRQDLQYHWRNRGYRDFADFLDAMKSSRRKTIRKERAQVAAQGVTIEVITGDALRAEHWKAFWPFYLATVDKRWGNAYLTREFFEQLGATLADRVVLVMASHGGRYVGGALNLRGADTLYGRVWGCLEDFRFLHFECCYYAAIEFAIAHGLAKVEAGAQGPHKLQRGYEPELTTSAHLLRHAGLRRAVADFVRAERAQVRRAAVELREALPFRAEAEV